MPEETSTAMRIDVMARTPSISASVAYRSSPSQSSQFLPFDSITYEKLDIDIDPLSLNITYVDFRRRYNLPVHDSNINNAGNATDADEDSIFFIPEDELEEESDSGDCDTTISDVDKDNKDNEDDDEDKYSNLTATNRWLGEHHALQHILFEYGVMGYAYGVPGAPMTKRQPVFIVPVGSHLTVYKNEKTITLDTSLN
jgi:hypothetical protein